MSVIGFITVLGIHGEKLDVCLKWVLVRVLADIIDNADLRNIIGVVVHITNTTTLCLQSCVAAEKRE